MLQNLLKKKEGLWPQNTKTSVRVTNQTTTSQQNDTQSKTHLAAAKEAKSSGPGEGIVPRWGIGGCLALLLWMGWEVAHGKFYTPRSPIGFYLGVAGSVMMLLAVLGYPLRKRLSFMRHWGAIKNWFRIHMFLGIMGPMLILFHSTFHVRSPNAGVALLSMLLVVASGIIGRFIYSKIHFGLYGRRATLTTLKEQVKGSAEETNNFLHISPKVQTWLSNFEHKALKVNRPFPESLLHIFGMSVWRMFLEFRCKWEIRRMFKQTKQTSFPGGVPEATFLISSYLMEIQQVAQFKMYERIFSLWHVLHIPLLYILAASGVFHIIAVYMY